MAHVDAAQEALVAPRGCLFRSPLHPVASTIRLDQSFVPSLHFPAPSSAAPPALPVRFLACSPLAFILCSSFPRGCITLPYSMAGMLLPPASQRDTFCRLANSNSEVKNGYRVVQKKRRRTQNTSPQVTPPLLPRHQCCWTRSSAPDVAKKRPPFPRSSLSLLISQH